MLKVLTTLIFLLLLEGVKRFIFRSGQPSDYFYYNLLSCVQLFILLGCIVILITRPLFKRFVKNLLLWQVAFCIVLLALLEIGCSYMLSHPKSIPAAVFPAFKFYYDYFECRILQLDSTTTRFDSTLYYKLKSDKRFLYSNREHTNIIETNSQGFRDDEHSLKRPDIIFLGDSYTIGWGVDENQTYAALVQQQTGLNVLNASMSSYGTARESIVLTQLDTTSVKYIVWQYCVNDQPENASYLANHCLLPPHKPEDLYKAMDLHSWTRRYFPGRHFLTIAKLTTRQFIGRWKKPRSPVQINDSIELQKARDFLDIVLKRPPDFSKTKLIVMDIGPYPLRNRFIQHLEKLVREKGLDRSILLIDCTTILNKDDFYTLDIHLTPRGNQKIAKAIADLLQANASK